jgi:hypothetical protein
MTPERFAKLVDARDRAESEMVRAFNRFVKLRGRVARAQKTLDREFAKRGEATVDDTGLAVPDSAGAKLSCSGDFNDDLPESL